MLSLHRPVMSQSTCSVRIQYPIHNGNPRIFGRRVHHEQSVCSNLQSSNEQLCCRLPGQKCCLLVMQDQSQSCLSMYWTAAGSSDSTVQMRMAPVPALKPEITGVSVARSGPLQEESKAAAEARKQHATGEASSVCRCIAGMTAALPVATERVPNAKAFGAQLQTGLSYDYSWRSLGALLPPYCSTFL